MTHPARRLLAFLTASTLAILSAATVSASGDSGGDDHGCEVSGTVTASFSTDPGYEGLWKYCIEIENRESDGDYHTGGEEDHGGFRLLLDLGECACLCTPGLFQFPPQPGHHEGDEYGGPASATLTGGGSDDEEEDDCRYEGRFHCEGAPGECGFRGPYLEFSPAGDHECDDPDSGSWTFCFYSIFPPATPSSHGLFNGDDEDDDEDDGYCHGRLTGSLPVCNCALPVRGMTWGGIKLRLAR